MIHSGLQWMELNENKKKAKIPKNGHPDAQNNPLGSALLFELHNVLVRCLVPPEQLLEINLFENGGNETAFEEIRRFLLPK